MDIFGFEVTAQNSLYQLLINFANEMLQVAFVQDVLVAEYARYEEEGIHCPPIDLADGVAVRDLVRAPPAGILVLLDEQVRLGKRGSDTNFLFCAKRAHLGRHAAFSDLKTDPDAFVVTHYAGAVAYKAHGFLVRNVDPLSADLAAALRASSDRVVGGWYPAVGDDAGSREAMLRSLRESTSKKFRAQMAALSDRRRPNFSVARRDEARVGWIRAAF